MLDKALDFRAMAKPNGSLADLAAVARPAVTPTAECPDELLGS